MTTPAQTAQPVALDLKTLVAQLHALRAGAIAVIATVDAQLALLGVSARAESAGKRTDPRIYMRSKASPDASAASDARESPDPSPENGDHHDGQ